MTSSASARVALVQCEVSDGVPTPSTLAAAGDRVRAAMTSAAADGARVVVFPEGTLAYPHKRLLSDWSVVPWPAVTAALESIARHAAALGVWTVVGAPHRLSGAGRRPHNSLYVISPSGSLVTRYDKRRLSMTEVTRLYTPGSDAVAFDVDGVRIGLALCLEMIFPELFVAYALDGVDLVVVASAPDSGGGFQRMAVGHAAMNATAVGLCCAAGGDGSSRSGVGSALGGWLSRSDDDRPCVVLADVGPAPDLGREYHRRARTDLYDGLHALDDPRSVDRSTF